MKSLLGLFAIALLGVGVVACGGANDGTSSVSQTASNTSATGSTLAKTVPNATSTTSTATLTGHRPKDANDGDDDASSDDDLVVLDYGHAASDADKRAVTALVTSYYAAGAADDGAKACTLIYGLIAETIPENYAQSPGLGGKSCGAIMSHVFKPHQHQLTADVAALKVTRVRVEGPKALAFVYLGATPEPYVVLHREDGAWKMESLVEVGLP